MRLYIAGIYASHFHRSGTLYSRCSPNARLLRDYVKHQLESYHFIKKGNYVKNIRADGGKVFLDSGAFSAFTQGVDVSVDQYAEFILANQDIIEVASVLDAIGDPEATFYNQQALEKLGCQVLPCFHFGEPPDLLEYYIKHYDHITLGGMVPISSGPLEAWLDEIWDRYLTDENGLPRVKVHGFGLTIRKLMAKYPWFSVDSSSWVQAAANGAIVLPEIPKAISISSRSPNRKVFGQHFDTLPETDKRRVLDLLEHYGLTQADVQEDYKARWALNCFTYTRLGAILGEDSHQRPFRAERQFLF